VHPDHLEAAGNLLICKENESDERREQFNQLTQASKSDGSLAIIQLAHPGNLTPNLINLKSSLVSEGNGRVLEECEICVQVVDRFVYAAQQVKLSEKYL
jgi:2,4-dienoyl-CoA reductase-like NADH-dependent reductase (Old Yellow Enzyme family)